MKTTLLITTYDRANLLHHSLDRLTHLTIPDEVLVIDDGGTDGTEGVCKEFESKLPIRYIYNHNPGLSICSFARNIGIKNAIGDIIITSEPELIWVTDVIPQMLTDMADHPEEIISAGTIYHAQQGCPYHPGLSADPVAALKDSIVENYQIQPRSYNQSGYCKTVNMQATFCALYKKSWLMELGGWDEEFPGNYGFDDIELCTRLRINGINQYIDANIECIHQWHPHQPPHIQGPMVAKNDEYFKSKRLDLLSRGDQGLIANKGREWELLSPELLDILNMSNHQKKNKPCPVCRKLIWQASKRCLSCSGKESHQKMNTPNYRNKMSVIAKDKGYGKWMKGKSIPRVVRDKISRALKGINKKEDVGYIGLHMRIKSRLSKTGICSTCNKTKITEWANKSRQYKNDLDDWLELCRSCHRKYDSDYRGFAKLRFGNLRRSPYV